MAQEKQKKKTNETAMQSIAKWMQKSLKTKILSVTEKKIVATFMVG